LITGLICHRGANNLQQWATKSQGLESRIAISEDVPRVANARDPRRGAHWMPARGAGAPPEMHQSSED
jgi:hypothetical protein